MVAEGASILDPKLAQYQYLGLATPVVVGYPEPGLTYSLFGASGPYSGLDRFGRIVDADWSAACIQYGYNRASSDLA